jgi:acetyl-CoA carboxylase beta subunit
MACVFYNINYSCVFSTNSCKQRNVTNYIYSLLYKYISSVRGVVTKVNECKTMKYQEALNRIAKYCGVNNGSMLEDDLKTLQELVDKATSKKPIEEIDSYDDYDYSYCPDRLVWFKIKK